jgi:hypothetical protein
LGFSLPRPRRFEYTFTPKHGSWLNLVEGFFSKFARSVLRHIDRRFQNSNHTGLSEFQHLAAQTGEDELSGFIESVAVSIYSHMLQRPPAENDMQRHFRVSPPSVHQMVFTLERAGLINPASPEAWNRSSSTSSQRI